MENKSEQKIAEQKTAPPKASMARKLFFNILGFFVGYCAGALAFQVAKWLFFDVLGQIKFLRSILSYPVDYSVYAVTGVIFIDALASLYVCGAVSKIGKANRNYSCYVLAAIRILSYIISLISSIKINGFNFEIAWTIIMSLIAFLVLMNTTAKNEDIGNL